MERSYPCQLPQPAWLRPGIVHLRRLSDTMLDHPWITRDQISTGHIQLLVNCPARVDPV
jgi:hypothetical protein